MASKTKTWEDKFHTKKEEKIEILTKRFADAPVGSKLLISTPEKIAKEVQKIKPGKFITSKDLRVKMAKSRNADFTCPVTMGIFLRIIAEREMERISAGLPIENAIPFWRVIEPGSALGKKLSFGEDFIVEMRKGEENMQ